MLKSCDPQHQSSNSRPRGVLTTTSKGHVLNHKSSLAPCVSRLEVLTITYLPAEDCAFLAKACLASSLDDEDGPTDSDFFCPPEGLCLAV